MGDFYVGVDVGTGSVRACVTDNKGSLLAAKVKEIKIWNSRPEYYEQSSDNIWEAVKETVQLAVAQSKVNPSFVKGIGFDATCSMVVLDESFRPVSVSLDGEAQANIVMWMDHRAQKEVDYINSTKHKVLDTVGGVMSPEMQPPKLMWLKKYHPKAWQDGKHFFDLPDFLTWKATNSLTRSLCSLVCKWSFQADTSGTMAWDDQFLSLIGVEDLAEDNHSKIGSTGQFVGSPCGQGLSEQAASELGLVSGTPVGTSIIDAHAGALACCSCTPRGVVDMPDLGNRLVLIAGTSNCHIICSPCKVSVPGVWGPYCSVMVPNMWVNEGGQSAAGSLIDFITQSHPAYSQVKEKADQENLHVYNYLNDQLKVLAASKGLSNISYLTTHLNMWPDFHGNRSPVADANLKGMLSGLSLSATEQDLALLYLATIQALAYGTRHIVTEMVKSGHQISIMYMCGGLSKNKLFVQVHTDVLGLPMVLPDNEESVLLGAAMLGACASGNFTDIQAVMLAMGGSGTVVRPDSSMSGFHEKKFAVFLEMLKDQRKYASLMA